MSHRRARIGLHPDGRVRCPIYLPASPKGNHLNLASSPPYLPNRLRTLGHINHSLFW